MSRLNTIIDAAADGTRPLPDVLRQVKILASRIGDAGLLAWTTKELTGYADDDDVPTYRGPLLLPVVGDWFGPFGSYQKHVPLSVAGIADDFLKAWFTATLRQPIAELEALAAADQDPGVEWDPYAVIEYERKSRNGEGGAYLQGMTLNAARVKLPRNVIVGILEAIRSRVLDLALDLEAVSRDVGEADGPTSMDARVGAVVQTFNITIYGDGANVATGDHARQRSAVQKGDTAALVEAARALGLSAEDADAFEKAVIADGMPDGERTRSFIERVRTGAIALTGDVVANVAATGLLTAAAGFFGG